MDSKGSQNEGAADPYEYIKRDLFTSEKFKIEVHNVPKYCSVKQFKRLLEKKFNLHAHKIKPCGSDGRYIFVNFKSEDDKQKGLKVLNGFNWKNAKLFAKPAQPIADPIVCNKLVIHAADASETIEEQIQNATTPLFNLTIDEQHEKKQLDVKEVMKNYGNKVKKLNVELMPWIQTNKKQFDGSCCQILSILPSPNNYGYRNKCEFTIGKQPKSGEVVVGFRLASYKAGSMGVATIYHLAHISDEMKQVVKIFEGYLRRCSLSPYDPSTYQGHWRQLTVRTTVDHDVMVVAVLHPQELSEDQITSIKTELKELFAPERSVKSVYLQRQGRKSSLKSDQYDLISGESHLIERLSRFKFRVSPESFFQINTLAAETLYQTVQEMAGLDSQTSLLDVCCGTGTIGIFLSQFVGEVLGVDIIPEAVNDAKFNCSLNSVTNCKFYDGKAESLLPLMINRVKYPDNVIAVLDPPRAGLHSRTISALRRADKLKTLVYLSCDPKLATQNFLDLARPTSNTYPGAPFVPVSVVPVDMFPHTPHYELVILFKRHV